MRNAGGGGWGIGVVVVVWWWCCVYECVCGVWGWVGVCGGSPLVLTVLCRLTAALFPVHAAIVV